MTQTKQNRYGDLDKELAGIHGKMHVAHFSELGVLQEQEFRVCQEMRRISEEDHAQVEEYRAAQGWKPCFKCQDERGNVGVSTPATP